jgi:hypothetical protein
MTFNLKTKLVDLLESILVISEKMNEEKYVSGRIDMNKYLEEQIKIDQARVRFNTKKGDEK